MTLKRKSQEIPRYYDRQCRAFCYEGQLCIYISQTAYSLIQLGKKPHGFLDAVSSVRRSSNFAHFFGTTPPDTVLSKDKVPFVVLKIKFSHNFVFLWKSSIISHKLLNCTHGKLFSLS